MISMLSEFVSPELLSQQVLGEHCLPDSDQSEDQPFCKSNKTCNRAMIIQSMTDKNFDKQIKPE